MRFSGKLLASLTLFALAGCSSLNPFSSKTETKNIPAVLQDFKASMAVKTLWSSSVGAAGNNVFTPVQVGSDIYAAAADGSVVKLESATGRPVWRINAGTGLTAGVGASATTVAVAGKKGLLFAYDTNGNLRWKVQASSEVLASPAVAKDVVVVRSIDNKIAAYDIETGVKKWSVERPLPILTLRIIPGIAIAEPAAIVALPGGKLASFSLNNGGLRWEVAAADPKGATELERIVDVSGTPVIAGADVCVVAYQGRVGCYDVATGASRWAKNLSSEVGVSVDERFVFAADNAGAISAYARATGTSAWRNDKLAYRRLSAPVSFGRSVAVGDGSGFVHFLSREDGSFIGRINTDGSPILAAPIVAGSNLIVQTKSGAVVALATE
ncbi:outer membrane protein assembly factor BamB [Undibacterium sp. Jales W-56]|uniref:outer membrane protein assembly factor BamB n=1 Tax=Undibacterium sp. Jales W-56 TaxID=2897325 RepID=UPI0021D1CC20|nr:outer membrane protein assembly factor BamB [Undibacterium sp. Jales W-56]MCU6433169.1 outer membrane protein assembly factor BamB [Undibacterium sp. Jales W-56]